MNTHSKVINLYKTLLYMGKDYPLGYIYFRDRAHTAFMKNRDVTNEAEIEKLLARGEFVVNEVKALYFLKKYRAMKSRYYDDEDEEALKVIKQLDAAVTENTTDKLKSQPFLDKKSISSSTTPDKN